VEKILDCSCHIPIDFVGDCSRNFDDEWYNIIVNYYFVRNASKQFAYGGCSGDDDDDDDDNDNDDDDDNDNDDGDDGTRIRTTSAWTTVAVTDFQAFGGPCGIAVRVSSLRGEGEYDQLSAANNRARRRRRREHCGGTATATDRGRWNNNKNNNNIIMRMGTQLIIPNLKSFLFYCYRYYRYTSVWRQRGTETIIIIIFTVFVSSLL